MILQKYIGQKQKEYCCLNDVDLDTPEKFLQQESIMFS